MSIKDAILSFTNGEIRGRIFITPDIPDKKLNAARSKYITGDEEILVLVDDTVFGSASEGLAIGHKYVYCKPLMEAGKRMKISAIKGITSKSTRLGDIEISFNNSVFITLSMIKKDDHQFLMQILNVARGVDHIFNRNDPAPAKKISRPRKVEISKVPEAACGACSASLPAGSKFCLECGAKVDQIQRCIGCDFKLPKKAKFCPECGATVVRKSDASILSPQGNGRTQDEDTDTACTGTPDVNRGANGGDGDTTSKLANIALLDNVLGEMKRYDMAFYCSIATVIDDDGWTSINTVAPNPVLILVDTASDDAIGLSGEMISSSQLHEDSDGGSGFFDVLTSYVRSTGLSEFNGLSKQAVDQHFLREFITGVYEGDLDDFQFENENASFEFYDMSDEPDISASIGHLGISILFKADLECCFNKKTKNLVINDDVCTSLLDVYQSIEEDSTRYAAFLSD